MGEHIDGLIKDMADDNDGVYIITKDGKPVAAVVSADFYEELVEAILSL